MTGGCENEKNANSKYKPTATQCKANTIAKAPRPKFN